MSEEDSAKQPECSLEADFQILLLSRARGFQYLFSILGANHTAHHSDLLTSYSLIRQFLQAL